MLGGKLLNNIRLTYSTVVPNNHSTENYHVALLMSNRKGAVSMSLVLTFPYDVEI